MTTGIVTLVPMVFLTSMLSGVIGMAGGMVLMGVLLMLYSPIEAIFLHGIIQFCANFQRYLQLRHFVQLRILFFYSLGALISYSLLRETSFRPSQKSVFIFMAVSALVGSFQLKAGLSVKNTWVCLLGGFVVNAVQVVGGVAGPVLDAFFQDKALSRFEIVGTKSVTSAATHVLKVFFMAGILESSRIQELLDPFFIFTLILASIVGTFSSKAVLTRLTDQNFFKICSTFLKGLSFFYMWKAFF